MLQSLSSNQHIGYWILKSTSTCSSKKKKKNSWDIRL